MIVSRLPTISATARSWFGRVLVPLVFALCADWPRLAAGEADVHSSEAILSAASEVYTANFADKPEGVHEKDGMLFVIARECNDRLTVQKLRTKAMLRCPRLLAQYAREHLADGLEPPPSSPLQRAFPSALAHALKAVPDLLRPRIAFGAAGRVLENRLDADRCQRIAYAMTRRDIVQALDPKLLFGIPTSRELGRALRLAWPDGIDTDNLDAMYAEFGLTEDALRHEWKEMGPLVHGAPWLRLPENMSAPRLAGRWRAAAGLVERSEPVEAGELLAVLSGAPLPEEIVAAMEEAALNSGRGKEALLWRLWRMGCVEPGMRSDKNDEEDARPRTRKATFPGLVDEYLPMLAGHRPDGIPDSVMKSWSGESSALAAAWRSFGHADFTSCAGEAGEEYHDAQRLFDQGVDLNRIIELTVASIEIVPAHAASWLLLGLALDAAGEGAAALPFMVQSLWLDPGSSDTRAGLALVYQKNGFPVLARGMAASVFFLCQNPSDWSVEKAEGILAEGSAVFSPAR